MRYIRDIQSRLQSIWNPFNERTTLTWDSLDREQYRVLGNGCTTSHSWDSAGGETAIGNYGPTGTALAQFTNTYSPVNTRLTVLELDGTQATFAYDSTRQLISEARGGTMAYNRSYVWDPTGNRLKQYDSGALTSGTFNPANQQTLISPPTGAPTTQTFDNAGNLTLQNTGEALVTSTWTPDNRLATYADNLGNSVSSAYSDDGLRRQRTNNSTTRNLTYDESILLLETDASNNLDVRYTGYPEVWGGLVSQNRSGTTSYYGLDSQGSSRILVSVGGSITDSLSWKAFGEAIQNGSGTENPYGYVANAAYYTELADLLNAWNRWPRPSTGQWRSVDPMRFVGLQSEKYAYVGGEPLDRTDPTGLAYTVTYCSPGTVTAIGLACNCIASLLPADWTAISNCITYNSVSLSMPQCKKMWDDVDTPSCYNDFCKCGKVSCCPNNGPSSSQCETRCSNGCGDTYNPKPTSNEACKGNVVLCFYKGGNCQVADDCIHNRSDYDWGRRNVGSPVASTMFHEIGHLCSVEHGTTEKFGCNDMFAFCIYQQCDRIRSRVQAPLPPMKARK